jgi:ABC-type polysaccharide/polyol phosphate export permease
MRELAGYWTNRHLLASLARQELRRTYAGTAAGLAWAVLTPLVPLLCFTAVFSLGLRLPLGGAPYVLGFAAAYVPWVLVSTSISNSAGSMVGHRYLVKRVRFPLEIVPGSSIVVQSLPHVILLALTIAAALVSGHARLPELLLLPYFYACAAIFALGLGLIVSALTVVVRDVQQVLVSFTNVWFWLTPIAWAASALPPRGRTLLALNPAAYVVSGYRHALMPRLFAAPTATDSLLFWTITAALMFTGIMLFRRLRPHFWECL